MGEISIKINIADRIYPLKVAVSEEEIVRRAAKHINERIKTFQDNYSVRDKQDLLSMSVLHYATTALKYDNKPIIEDDGISQRLSALDNLLTDYLEKQ